MTKILALDIATQTGVAVGKPGEKPLCWSENMGKGEDEKRLAKILHVTNSLILTHKPDFVAMEAPVGGAKANFVLIGYWQVVRAVVAHHKVPGKTFAISEIRKHFLGKNLTTRDFPTLKHSAAKKAIKEHVVARCQLLKWDVPNDDAADAAALWDLAMSRQSRGYQAAPTGGLF